MLAYIKETLSQIRQLFGEPDDIKEERLLLAKTTVLPLENSELGKISCWLNGRKNWPLLDPENGHVDQLIVMIYRQEPFRGMSMGNFFYVPQDSFRFRLQIVNDQDKPERTDTFETQLIDLDKNRVWREGIRGRDPRLGNPDA